MPVPGSNTENMKITAPLPPLCRRLALGCIADW
jgi:hypothetical protein